jgi:hypothetical protein
MDIEKVKMEMRTEPKFFRFWFFNVNDVEKFEDAFLTK